MSRAWALLDRVDAPSIDDPNENHMTRWRIVATPWFGLYIHRIATPDPRPTLHDHPWPFISLILRGGYIEDFGIRDHKAGPLTGITTRSWRAGSIHRMRKTDAHVITRLHRSLTWTLLVVGRRRPEPSWGYWDYDGWTPFDEHPHALEFAEATAARAHGHTTPPESFAGARRFRGPRQLGIRRNPREPGRP